MKIKILEKCFLGDGRNHRAGDTLEVDDRIGEKLVARGFAVEMKKPGRKKMSLMDRVFDADEIETPEE